MSRKYPARAVSLAAIAVLGLGLAACSSSGSGSRESSSSGNAASSGFTKKNLELVVGTKSDDFYITMECGAEAEAKKLGAKLTVNGRPTSRSLSRPRSSTRWRPAKPDALMVAPTDAKALDPELQRIQTAGTKIVFVDTSSSDTSLGVSRIAPTTSAAARSPRTTWASRSAARARSRSSTSTRASAPPTPAIQGFNAEMKAKYPNVKVLGVQYDDDSSATAASQVASDIAAHPDLNGVFATNVLSAQGAATGVQHAGKSGKVKVATFDAEPQQISSSRPIRSSSPWPRTRTRRARTPWSRP